MSYNPEYHRRWRAANREKCREYTRKHHEKKYTQDPEARAVRAKKIAEQRAADPEPTRAADRKYYYAHREQRLAAHAVWVENNKEHVQAKNKEWQEANVEHLKSYKKARYDADDPVERKRKLGEWVAANPEKVKEHNRRRNHNRRQCLLGLSSDGVTSKQWQEILEVFSHSCAYCLCQATAIDHLTPIFLGGKDEPDNVVPACKRCNSSKGKKPLLQWLLKCRIAQEALR